MLFNSLLYALFLPVVFALYWFVGAKRLSFQNFLLLVASYFFYACWDWRFLFLLAFSTLLDYIAGIKISGSQDERIRKRWFLAGLVANLGLFVVFKYFNFFSESFSDLVSLFGCHPDSLTLNIVLPLGLSFYTFHSLSYLIDCYKDRIPAEKNPVNYAVFVSFFPLLVAGPIERAAHLLPQIKIRREFDDAKAVDGLRQILWGLVKKVVIADQCGEYADLIFSHSGDHSGSTLFIGALLFSFQIYGDFSGYSDIAIGTARLLGFDVLRNFAFPYFSRNIPEFWRRWHISLSSWFRDYVFIPLGGSRIEKWLRIRNVFFVFLLSGFWHGANWTFVVWGFLNALYMLPSLLFNKTRQMLVVAQGKLFPTFRELVSIGSTFLLTTLTWIFFREKDLGSALNDVRKIFSPSVLEFPAVLPRSVLLYLFCFMLMEWFGRENEFAIQKTGMKWHRVFRWSFYLFLAILIFLFNGKSQQFIYFQF